MAGTMNTQASEFPQDPDILTTGTTNADEFRDIDLVTTAHKHSTTDFSAVASETVGRPVDGRAEKVAERRLYANGPDAISVANVSEQGARRYGSFSSTALPGTGGYAGAPVLLMGEDRSRIRSVLSNAHATDPVMIGTLDMVGNGGGLALPPGVLFETTVTEPVYACVPVGGAENVTVGVWTEYA